MQAASRLIAVCFSIAPAFGAQADAAAVLATSITYRTLSANVYSEDTRREVDKLRELATAAGIARQYGDALRHYNHGIALMRGTAWTPAVELASSLALKADHTVWESGQRIRLSLESRFPTSSSVAKAVRASLRLQGPDAGNYHELNHWDSVNASWSAAVSIPDLPPGKCRLEMQFSADDKTPLPAELTQTVSAIVQPGLRHRMEVIRTRINRLKTSPGTALWTARYIPESFDQVDKGETEITRYDAAGELAFADELLSALESGSDPLANRTGDTRRAYESDVDNTLQPYRLYVPRSHIAERAYPLIVALHGMGGDENTLFDRYGDKALVKEAERNGYIIVAPKGREPASMYRGAAEKDVLDVIAQVRSSYRIDPNRIYLLGHSMGAYGTWSIAANHPEIFAALAPVAGGGNPATMSAIRHIPQIVIHGDKDPTVPVSASRVMVEAARKLDINIKYLEIAGGGHVDVFVPAIPEMFSWFNTHRKPAAKVANQ